MTAQKDNLAAGKNSTFEYQEVYPLGPDKTKYRLLTKEYVSGARIDGNDALKVEPEGLSFLANQAMREINFLLRREHLGQVAAIHILGLDYEFWVFGIGVEKQVA